MDVYDPLFTKWTGSGEHYAFLNQPRAAMANFQTLVIGVAPALEKEDLVPRLRELVQRGCGRIRGKVDDMWRTKMGFSTGSSVALFEELEPLLRRSSVDYTIFLRQLAAVAEAAE